MAKFSNKSLERLKTCHPDLQRLFNEVIKHVDCTIIEGHRGKEAQNKAYKEGASNVMWPFGNHNTMPSEAVDAALYPIDWDDTEGNYYFAGFVMGVAAMMGIKIRSGSDWDQDEDFHDQRLIDVVHFELVGD